MKFYDETDILEYIGINFPKHQKNFQTKFRISCNNIKAYLGSCQMLMNGVLTEF